MGNFLKRKETKTHLPEFKLLCAQFKRAMASNSFAMTATLSQLARLGSYRMHLSLIVVKIKLWLLVYFVKCLKQMLHELIFMVKINKVLENYVEESRIRFVGHIGYKPPYVIRKMAFMKVYRSENVSLAVQSGISHRPFQTEYGVNLARSTAIFFAYYLACRTISKKPNKGNL
uniref:Uncharacterized protein n=1 Tax=Glossina palpalis gambiensis TaxID=67801 RepID=A0A1B0ATB0_9MUSC